MVKNAQKVTISGWQSDFMWPLKTFLEVTRSHPRYLECSPTSRLSNAPTLMVVRHHNPFLMKQTWKNSIFWKNNVKNPISCREKTFSFCEAFASKCCKKFSRGPTKSSKVSRMFSYIRAFERTNSHGRTTPHSFFNEANVKYMRFFKK